MALFYLHKEALLLLQALGKKWLMPSLQMLISMCQVVIVLLAICGLLTAFEQVFDWRCPERLDIGFPKKSGVCLVLNLNEFCNLREFKVPCCRFRAGSSTLSLLYRVLCLVIHKIRSNSCHI
jgi:hypothetical protein